ncbi:hypothetical protein ABPG72_015683 [Tetrahymena utriculariae]
MVDYAQNQHQINGKGKKELLFSGGAGAVGFQMGYTHGIMEIVGKDTLKEYCFGGVSAGTAVAGFTLMALYSDVDLKQSYQNQIRKLFQKENRKYLGLISNGELIFQMAKDFWDDHQKLNLPSLNERYHVYYTSIEGILSLKENIVHQFTDQIHFAHSLEASCTLPIITRFGLYKKFNGQKVLDGGFTKPIPYRYRDSKKVFLNVMPKALRYTRENIQNLSIIDLTENSDVSFPLDYWVWSEYWADEMFLKGYLQALQDKDIIAKAFQEDEECDQKIDEKDLLFQ